MNQGIGEQAPTGSGNEKIFYGSSQDHDVSDVAESADKNDDDDAEDMTIGGK